VGCLFVNASTKHRTILRQDQATRKGTMCGGLLISERKGCKVFYSFEIGMFKLLLGLL